ncbi:hypothetical protein [Bacillus subtilis]|uniref:hypothetical protein n=1 Tax=Bacillus subtilis TaxID=1423 RepID=UPI00178D05DD|nr:hypothetical protein [Bacillus subtilis]QOJ79938.1 hypothetical protein IHV08_11185 [Bacillus subtilis]
MTSYDQIWETFLNNCETSDFDVPQTEEQIYQSIRNAILHFNNRLRDSLKADDSTETVNRDLSEDDLLIIAHFLRYIFLLNKKTLFENTWQPFTNDVGIKNFGTQLNSLKQSVIDQKNEIERLILNAAVDFL